MRCSLFLFVTIAFISSPLRAEDYWARNGCVIDSPKGIFEGGNFSLDKENGLAKESRKLEDGVVLVITQAGCEYSTQQYKFIVDGELDTQYTGSEYRKALQLLKLYGNNKSLKEAFDNARPVIEKYLGLIVSPELGEVLYLRLDDHFSEEIWVDAAQGEGFYSITVTLSAGPY